MHRGKQNMKSIRNLFEIKPYSCHPLRLQGKGFSAILQMSFFIIELLFLKNETKG